MDARLRKRHKFIWIFLAPIITVLAVLASKDLSFSSEETMLISKNETGKVLKQMENEEIRMILIENLGKNLLQVQIKSPMKATSSILFGLTENSEKESVLGQLEGVGTYSFQVKEIIEGILIKDAIKNQQILKLEF